jgi:hypothetical protein
MKNITKGEFKEIGLRNVFSFIFDGLLLIFLIILGVETIKTGHLFIGLLYFILSLLIFVPHHFLRITHALKIVIIIILFIVVAAISGKNTPPVEQKYDKFSLNQEFNLVYGNDTFSMTVKEAKPNANISVSGKDVTTSGSFIIVTGDIKNTGLEAVDFKFKTDPELLDNQGRRYSLYGAAIPVGKLQPSVAKEVSFVFEIPTDASGLKFIVKDKTVNAKSIDLKK